MNKRLHSWIKKTAFASECKKCGCVKETKHDSYYPYVIYSCDGIETKYIAPECSERFVKKVIDTQLSLL